MQDKHVDAFTDKVGGHVNSVIGLLLRHSKTEIRTLGARLLAQFEKAQVWIPSNFGNMTASITCCKCPGLFGHIAVITKCTY